MGQVSSKIYKRDDFEFDIVKFPFLDGEVSRSASYGVNISKLIRFASMSNHVTYFNTRNKILTAKLLHFTLRKSFYAPEGTSGGILKSHRPSVRLSVRPSVSPLQIVSQRYLINY